MASLTSKLSDNKIKKLCALLGDVELTLLYQASVHGYKASAFHQKCDHQDSTLHVAYNSSGYIFGGYTSVDYSQSWKEIIDEEAFLFSFQRSTPVFIKVNSGSYALTLANSYSFAQTVRHLCSSSQTRDELMEMIRNYKPLVMSVSCARILMIGPVGAGKSSFFNSIFMGHVTNKATQFRTYSVKDGRGGKPLPFVLCDTMGLEEQFSNSVQDWILKTSTVLFKATYQTAIKNIEDMETIASDLTAEQRSQLCDLLGNVELSLLYKASVHGYKASAFHQRCDRQGPTLLVAYNSSGYIFGGYNSVEYAQSDQNITDKKALLFRIRNGSPLCIKVNSGYNVRIDDAEMPSFGRQLYFCYNNQPVIYYRNIIRNALFDYNPDILYGENDQLTEFEVYKVEQTFYVSVKEKPWRNILWTAERREELIGIVRNHKPLLSTINRVKILMIGPVGAGKSTLFNSINSIFMGHVTSKAMSGSAQTSVTTQFRTYPIRDGQERKPLPFVLCDTMGLEEQSGAGLNIADICSILQGRIQDRYEFNPGAPFQPEEQKSNRTASLQEKIHCVVYVIDATKISLMSEKLEEKLHSVRCQINSLAIPQMAVMTKVDEACPHVHNDLQNIYASSYIKMKMQEVSSRLGVPVSCVLPVKNYSQELELDLNCDVLLLTALQQMLRLADDYLDDVDSY